MDTTGDHDRRRPNVAQEAAELAASAAALAKEKAELEDELAHDFMPKKLRGILPEVEPFKVPGPLA